MRKPLPTQRIFQEMTIIDPAVLLSDRVRVHDGRLAVLHKLAAKFEVGYHPHLFKSTTDEFLSIILHCRILYFD